VELIAIVFICLFISSVAASSRDASESKNEHSLEDNSVENSVIESKPKRDTYERL
jgi:hypothetical protein